MPIEQTTVTAKKTAFYVLLIYMACQLSTILLFIIPGLERFLLSFIDRPTEKEALVVLAGWWSTFAFGIAFILSYVFILRDKRFWHILKGEKASLPATIGWGIIGFFLVLIGQTVAAYIELLLGIEVGSKNTQNLLTLMDAAPIMMISIVLFGPVLEEIVFRRVLFGSIIQQYNFWIAGIISAIIFAAIHVDFTHILLYTVCGLIFAFLYYKTKRLLTSIIAHVLLNGFIVVYQLNAEKIQPIFDRFFS